MNKWIKYAGFLYLALLAVQIFQLKSTGKRPESFSLLPDGVWDWIETLMPVAIATTPAIPAAPAATVEPTAAEKKAEAAAKALADAIAKAAEAKALAEAKAAAEKPKRPTR